MNYHLRIVLSMLGIVYGSAQKNIDWKLGMSEAEQKATVKAGTKVVFKWSNFHDVYQMKDKTAYDKCDFTGGTKLAEASVNSYTYTAKTAGVVYFSCSISSGNHCKSKQKLTLTITGTLCVCVTIFVPSSFGYLQVVV